MERDGLLRILILEDMPSDAELAEWALRHDGLAFTSRKVDSRPAFVAALRDFRPDVIVSDYLLPQFNGMEALKLSLADDPERPFILLTGSMNEETAVASIKAGAADYVLKEKITRLPLAVRGALAQQRARLDREEAVRELTAIYENAPLIMLLVDQGLRIHKANRAAAAFARRGAAIAPLTPSGELLHCREFGRSGEDCGSGEACRDCVLGRVIRHTIATGRGHDQEEWSFVSRTEAGETVRAFLLSTTSLPLRGEPLALVSLLEITERKRTEEMLSRAEENFRRSLDESPLGVRILTAEGETLYANQTFLNLFGYGCIEELNETPIEQRYTPESYAEVAERRAVRRQSGQGPAEYEVSIVRRDGEIRHLHVFRKEVLWNSQPRFQTIYQDITERKQTQERLEESLHQLRQAFETTVQVMVSSVEARDPYTAGHQSRSADLARAIALEMGLDAGRVEAIRMAGSIHDIGKLSIPAEILSKPAKLSEIEYALIKEHSKSGYEILKNVESPWPLAEIVYQHHERIDGSGYPRRLKGGEILLEARILAVSDVVESMASHRPYRPALGIEAALAEIESHRGVLYDAGVADACLRLFREKGFRIERPY